MVPASCKRKGSSRGRRESRGIGRRIGARTGARTSARKGGGGAQVSAAFAQEVLPGTGVSGGDRRNLQRRGIGVHYRECLRRERRRSGPRSYPDSSPTKLDSEPLVRVAPGPRNDDAPFHGPGVRV